MEPRIVLYCCNNSVIFSDDDIEQMIPGGQADIRISRLPCSGRTDVLYLVRAIEAGADAALVVACPKGQCQFLEGNIRAGMRVRYANRLLAEAGMGNNRIRMTHMDPANDRSFPEALQDTVAAARKIMEE